MKKLRKVNTDWHQISIKEDKYEQDIDVVAIFRTKFNEWSVCDGQPVLFRRVSDYNRYVFTKLSAAKLFAKDLALAIENETIYPLMSDSKYWL